MLTKSQTSFAEGWKVFYQVRTLFVVLLMVSMAVNIGIFITAKFSKVVIPRTTRVNVVEPTTTAAVTQPNAREEINPEMARWQKIFRIAMDVTAVVGTGSAIFLVFCALVGLMMIIAGQTPGAGFVAGAFFWAVLMVVVLLPWSSLMPSICCLPVGLPGFNAMQGSMMSCGSAGCQVNLWLRFVVYPLLVLLITVLYLVRTNQANKQIFNNTTQDVISQFK